MDRVERALIRIERAVDRGAMSPAVSNIPGPDTELRARVAAALGELDAIIREAQHG